MAAAAGSSSSDSEPALWALTQTFTRARRRRRARATASSAKVRHHRLRPGPDPPARAHASRGQGGPPAPDARDAGEPLADLLALLATRDGAAWSALEPATARPPWGEVTDDEGTTHRLWRVSDPAAIARVQEALAGAELLIADGHHRYETARTYAEEIGGEGEHRYVLMCLVSMSDPGLAIFPTHRLVGGLDDGRGAERLDELLERDFELTEVDARRSSCPNAATATCRPSGCSTRGASRRAAARAGLAGDRRPRARRPLRELPPARHRRAREARARGRARPHRGRHLAPARPRLRARPRPGACSCSARRATTSPSCCAPTPVEQVQAVAAAGETMPPKSTYFFPKLLSRAALQPALGLTARPLDQRLLRRTSRRGASATSKSPSTRQLALHHRLRGMDLPGGDARERRHRHSERDHRIARRRPGAAVARPSVDPHDPLAVAVARRSAVVSSYWISPLKPFAFSGTNARSMPLKIIAQAGPRADRALELRVAAPAHEGARTPTRRPPSGACAIAAPQTAAACARRWRPAPFASAPPGGRDHLRRPRARPVGVIT